MQISGQTLGCRKIRWRLLLTAGLCRHCWLSVQEEKERVRHFWELQSCCLFDGLVVGLNIHRLDLNWFARLSIMQPWLWNCLLPLHALSKGIKRIKLFRQYLWKHIKDLSKPRRFDCRSSFEDDTHAQGLRRQTFRRNLYEPFYWEKGWRLYRNTSIIQSQVCHIRPHAKIHPRVLNQVGGEMRPDTWEMVDRLNNREEWGEKREHISMRATRSCSPLPNPHSTCWLMRSQDTFNIKREFADTFQPCVQYAVEENAAWLLWRWGTVLGFSC